MNDLIEQATRLMFAEMRDAQDLFGSETDADAFYLDDEDAPLFI